MDQQQQRKMSSMSINYSNDVMDVDIDLVSDSSMESDSSEDSSRRISTSKKNQSTPRTMGNSRSSAFALAKRVGKCRARHPRTGNLFCVCKARQSGLCLLHESQPSVLRELSEGQKVICMEQRRHAKQMELRSKEINASSSSASSNTMAHMRILGARSQLQEHNRNSLQQPQFQLFPLEQQYSQQASICSPWRQQARPVVEMMDNCDNCNDSDEGEDLYADNDEDHEEELAELEQMELDELEDDSFVVSDDADMDEEEEEQEFEEEEQEEGGSSSD